MTSGFTHKKIRNEKSTGEKLCLARKHLGYSLEIVEKETKVSLKYLQHIENNDYEKLPADVYVIGFLRRYAEFLNINPLQIIQPYQQERQIALTWPAAKKSNRPADILKPNLGERWLKTPRLVITPKLILSSAVILLVVGILSYILYQVKGFAAAPQLQLQPQSIPEVVQVESIIIAGQTDGSASLFINNQPVSIDQNGNFSQAVQLVNGLNSIDIISRSKANKETKKVIKVLAEY